MDCRASLPILTRTRAARAHTPACAYQPLREEHVGKAVAGLAHDVGAEWSMQRMCIHADRTRCAMLPPLEIEMRTAGCRVGAPLKRRCQKPNGLGCILRHTWAAIPVAIPLPPGACRQTTQIQPLIRTP